jgi:hypothetical protein
MLRFIVWQHKRGVGFSSISAGKASVIAMHNVAGIEPPQCGVRVFLLMRAVRKQTAKNVKKAAPITPELMRGIVSWALHFPAATVDIKLMWTAALLIGYAGLMRKSEILNLDMKDIRLVDQGMEVVIRFSKTDQSEKTFTVKMACPLGGLAEHPNYCQGTDLCPVCAWRKYKILRQSGPFRNAEEAFPGFSYVTLLWIIRDSLHTLGHNAEDYASHSLRRGAAQALDEAGAEPQTIKLAGRWMSDCYMEYLQQSWAHAGLVRGAHTVGGAARFRGYKRQRRA